jgi:two-component system, NarL family, response regulator NreC
MRTELASLIQEQDEMNVVGQAASGEEAVQMAKELRPDVILMDVVMPGMNGIVASREIQSALPQTRILALSNHTGRSLVEALLAAGACGYLRKDQAYEELIPAILSVSRGEEYIGEHVDA